MAKPSPAQASLQWHQLSGPQFDAAVDGEHDSDWKLVAAAWLKSPKLKYYMRRSALLGNRADTRMFFLATVEESPAPRKGRAPALRQAVGMLEIDFEDGSSSTVGLKYVTVDPDFRNQGIATRLYEQLIEHLQKEKLTLYRTRPGKETPSAFTESITRMLAQRQVDWHGREP